MVTRSKLYSCPARNARSSRTASARPYVAPEKAWQTLHNLSEDEGPEGSFCCRSIVLSVMSRPSRDGLNNSAAEEKKGMPRGHAVM